MSLNKVILHGNLTRDPELRYLPNGTPVAGFGLAVNRKWKDDQGQDHEEVTFVDVEVWARRAEVVAKYFKKGSQILLEGRLKLEQWEDKNNHEKRSKLKVVLENFTFVGTKSDEGGGNGSHQRSSRPPARGSAVQPDAAAGSEVQEDVDQDIPF